MEYVSIFPATITISSPSAHVFSLPDLPTGQAGSSTLVQTMSKGQTFVAQGWVKEPPIPGVNYFGQEAALLNYWVTDSGYYIMCGTTEQQPDPNSTPMPALAQPSAQTIAEANAAVTDAVNNQIQVPSSIGAAVSGAWNSITGAVSGLVSGAFGGDVVDIIWLIIIVFAIYAVLSTGALNLVHFKKRDNQGNE